MKRNTWVIKIGSQAIVDGGERLIKSLMADVVELSNKFDIVWVSSGAISMAQQIPSVMERQKKRQQVAEKQALSAMGQPMLIAMYQKHLNRHHRECAQVLVSGSDLKKSVQRENFLNTMKHLIKWGCLPIINENDAVATDEIRFGDNDQLAALVAKELGAKRLTLLSNVDGLLDHDGRLVERIPKVTKVEVGYVHAGKSTSGTGGMLSKLKSAQLAARHGVRTDIVNALHPEILLELAQGQHPGTLVGA